MRWQRKLHRISNKIKYNYLFNTWHENKFLGIKAVLQLASPNLFSSVVVSSRHGRLITTPNAISGSKFLSGRAPCRFFMQPGAGHNNTLGAAVLTKQASLWQNLQKSFV